MNFRERGWVSFSRIYGFVLVIDDKRQKCLMQFRNNDEQDMKWVPVQMLASREEVRLLEDIGELEREDY